ncbi:hypothetical protein B2J93_7065 [Marssonina coronariae]|uniref:Uncharacterized protein n=1 Tax=Diplocarpon coronariae TaxID=2795749 RepID=A0A218ZGV8_9HELO|nr:hypothetical protein B2J93_7065 [Marssonina coronariae]
MADRLLSFAYLTDDFSDEVTLGAGISALDQAAIEAPTEGSQESLVKAYLIALASELERALEPRESLATL